SVSTNHGPMKKFRRLSEAAPAPHLCYERADCGNPPGSMSVPSPSATPVPAAAPAGVLEKVPLERYVPPAKPSLVGLSRGQLADHLATAGRPAPQPNMRDAATQPALYV